MSSCVLGFRPIYWKCWSNNVVATILRWFDLVTTLRWPYHDLGITPNTYHVTMCTWIGFRPIYFYTTLRIKGTLLRWPLVTLSMHRKSADHLKVTWHIIRLKKIWSTKVPRGRGGEGRPKVYITFISNTNTGKLIYRPSAHTKQYKIQFVQ